MSLLRTLCIRRPFLPRSFAAYGYAVELISQTSPPLSGRPILEQFWADLTFIHWRVDAAAVAPLLPPGIVPDVFDGSSWVGLIPFRMQSTAALGGPHIPYFGTFTEVNVRLYAVDEQGRRGVVFASLEASRLAAVLGARVGFGLPYFWADATAARRGDEFAYRSERLASGRRTDRPVSHVVSRNLGVPVVADPLADFLTARWRLFLERNGRTVMMPNQHGPWPLFTAELTHLHDDLVAAAGLPGITDRQPDSVLFSPGVLTQFGLPERITG
jgi:uncharacterized protein YqjF (DUF2071 family)